MTISHLLSKLSRPILASPGIALDSGQRAPNTLIEHADIRFGVIKAMNGSIIEVGTYKPNMAGPDWTYECYIVKDHESLAEALATIMMIKGVNK